MATKESAVIASMAPFASEELTTSALRVLAFTGLHDLERALRRGDYHAAQEAAYAVLHTSEVLEQRGETTRSSL